MRKSLPSEEMTEEQREILTDVKGFAAQAAIELADSELLAGRRRIVVVVVVEPQPDGIDVLGTGIGHPEDMPVVAEAAAAILRAALATLDVGSPTTGNKTFS